MTFTDTTEKVIVQPDILNETAAIVPEAHRFSQDYQLLHSGGDSVVVMAA
ncbi:MULTISPECIES: hypothetical protein [Microcystis]|jgi:hypothetical protein|nr:hypothetical protein [Microcystis aeruginosa]ODV38995.1 Lead, cadmium, zinc and mercury transporting ATPase [Microcystis aeruginosa NIES-98]